MVLPTAGEAPAGAEAAGAAGAAGSACSGRQRRPARDGPPAGGAGGDRPRTGAGPGLNVDIGDWDRARSVACWEPGPGRGAGDVAGAVHAAPTGCAEGPGRRLAWGGQRNRVSSGFTVRMERLREGRARGTGTRAGGEQEGPRASPARGTETPSGSPARGTRAGLGPPSTKPPSRAVPVCLP